ncbi:hypothetical protein TNCV_3554171 [Trichonephila clavipes]|nr:hypothetical protein TNCV_3554171 [Trichonephila clavipes]
MRGECSSPVVKVSNHGRHVMSSSPVPLKTRRVGQRCMLNLSRAQKSSRRDERPYNHTTWPLFIFCLVKIHQLVPGSNPQPYVQKASDKPTTPPSQQCSLSGNEYRHLDDVLNFNKAVMLQSGVDFV